MEQRDHESRGGGEGGWLVSSNLESFTIVLRLKHDWEAPKDHLEYER